MKTKHYLSVQDFTSQELQELTDLSIALKKAIKAGVFVPLLAHQSLGMIFEQPSTRTRVSLETAMEQLGGHGQYLAKDQMQLGKSETIEDTGRVLSRLVDAVSIRIGSEKKLYQFVKNATVPVINAMTDHEHPTQALADLITICEHLPEGQELKETKVVFVGEATQVCRSLGQITTKMGMHFVHYGLKGYQLTKEDEQIMQQNTEKNGGSYLVTDEREKALKNADFVYTDVWYGTNHDKRSKEDRMEIFSPTYQVNKKLMALAKPNAKFMHCLPAVRGEEVAAEVIDDPEVSIVFDEAENRLTAMRGILVSLNGQLPKETPEKQQVEKELKVVLKEYYLRK